MLIRLTHGVSVKAVKLAQHAVASLGRGDYARLVEQELCDPEAIVAAANKTILACVDNDPNRLRVVREAATAMERDTVQTAGLEPYEA